MMVKGVGQKKREIGYGGGEEEEEKKEKRREVKIEGGKGMVENKVEKVIKGK